MSEHKFPYTWALKDAVFTKDKGTVFSCFACGGGSTMGYKLAGFDVIGCNEIDPKMMACYIENHKPKYSYLEPIQTFAKRKDLPKDLYNLDILDGSPPCSSFSMAGNREKDWGKEKVFREGQAEQVLDTLFFDFIDLAKELQPKVVVAENVKGLLMGNAVKYVSKIYEELDNAGYYVTHTLLDASKMGVPQRRERVFFTAIRKDLGVPFLDIHDMFQTKPYIDLVFKEREISFLEIKDGLGKGLTDFVKKLWDVRLKTDKDLSLCRLRLDGKEFNFGTKFMRDENVCLTLTSQGYSGKILFNEPKYISDSEIVKAGSFPFDYNYLDSKSGYLIGMSVPPVMTAQIATRIYEQWLSKLK